MAVKEMREGERQDLLTQDERQEWSWQKHWKRRSKMAVGLSAHVRLQQEWLRRHTKFVDTDGLEYID